MSGNYQGSGHWQVPSLGHLNPLYIHNLKARLDSVLHGQEQNLPRFPGYTTAPSAGPSMVTTPQMPDSGYSHSLQKNGLNEFLMKINNSTGSFCATPSSASDREDYSWSSKEMRMKRKRNAEYDEEEEDRAKKQKTPVRRNFAVTKKNLTNLYATHSPKRGAVRNDPNRRNQATDNQQRKVREKGGGGVANGLLPHSSSHPNFSAAVEKLLKGTQPLPSNVDKLSQEIWNYYLQKRQTQENLDVKFQLRNRIFGSIVQALGNVLFGLHITGSSLNGFGNRSSDLDMCLMLTDSHHRSTPSRSVVLDCLYKIQGRFRINHPYFKNMSVIRARVPIIRFTDMRSGLDCDININNSTGIRNTHLLQIYSKLDWRVVPLVMIVKQWASAHDINDASQSTLSSYSLALMVIHYLQVGAKPPVIPSLQQLHPTIFRTNSDVRNLVYSATNFILPDYLQYNSENNQSLAELLKGFFRYFAEVFRFSSQVISVRLGIAYPKSSINTADLHHWKHICIEEPFDSNNTARPVYLESKFRQIVDTFKTTNAKMKNARSIYEIL